MDLSRTGSFCGTAKELLPLMYGPGLTTLGPTCRRVPKEWMGISFSRPSVNNIFRTSVNSADYHSYCRSP